MIESRISRGLLVRGCGCVMLERSGESISVVRWTFVLLLRCFSLKLHRGGMGKCDCAYRSVLTDVLETSCVLRGLVYGHAQCTRQTW